MRDLGDLVTLFEIKSEYEAVLRKEEFDLGVIVSSSDEDLKTIGLPKGIRMKLLKWAKAMSEAP